MRIVKRSRDLFGPARYTLAPEVSLALLRLCWFATTEVKVCKS